MKSWALPAAIIVAAEYLVALMIGARVGFHYSIPFSSYFVAGLTVVGGGGAAAIGARLVVYARAEEQQPTRRLLSEVPAFSGFAFGVLLVALQMAVLSWTKIMLPIASPFWADPLLARADHLLFGTDPWRIAAAGFGWADPAIDRAYIVWAPVKFIVLIVLLMLPESDNKTRALLSYFLIMASAALGQYVLSSAGPVFFAQFGFGNRYSALPVEPWVAAARSYLWRDYLRNGGNIGTGISAMPSLHVAIALWVALVVRAYAPKLAALGYSYFALILVGSVLLGWHYASDGVVAIAIAVIAWRVASTQVSGSVDKPIELPIRSVPSPIS